MLIILGVILEKVINYCKKHDANPNSSNPDYIKEVKDWDAEFVNNIDKHTFNKLIIVVSFLQIQPLIDLIIQTVVNTLKDMSVEEIREKFKIQNDFTPKEEKHIRSEYPWAFDHSEF